MIKAPSEAIKIKRQALRWSPDTLAAELGRKADAIHKLESGDLSDEELFREVADLLDNEIVKILPFWEKLLSEPSIMHDSESAKAARKVKLVEFGRLVRDRRNKARLSRQTLAKLARLSDATIKFIETARHPPSRSTCQALVSVQELGLKWEDVAILGYVGKKPLALVPQETTAPGQRSIDPMPAAETSDPSLSISTEQPGDSGQVIEEEITTHIRRVIRRR